MLKGTVARWQTNFFTGLAVILPIVITLMVAHFVFFTISGVTDTLLFFVPKRITHQEGPGGPGTGELLWNWRLLALLFGFLMVSIVGRLTRYYVGRKLFQSLDYILLSIPMLNKIYSTIKQVNDAFSSNKKSAFEKVVLVEFPRPGLHSVGFVTGEGEGTAQKAAGPKVLSVFVPTTPNPTTGFLVLVPENELVFLDISVAEGIKFLISLGSVPPEHSQPSGAIPAQLATLPDGDGVAKDATQFITAAVQQAKVNDPSPSSPDQPVPKPPEHSPPGIS